MAGSPGMTRSSILCGTTMCLCQLNSSSTWFATDSVFRSSRRARSRSALSSGSTATARKLLVSGPTDGNQHRPAVPVQRGHDANLRELERIPRSQNERSVGPWVRFLRLLWRAGGDEVVDDLVRHVGRKHHA